MLIHSHEKKAASAWIDHTERKGGKYVISFGEKAFRSDFTMYMTMGHEYTHVAHYINFPYNHNLTEIGAYEWTKSVLRGAPSRVGHFKGAEINQSKFLNAAGLNMEIFRQRHAGYLNFKSWGLPTTLPKALH